MFFLTNRWRQRWFTLRHSGELPGQYFLEYYEDKRCRKLKGRIDLDQCEQVDAGLSLVNRKERYQYMFNVKTPKRVYYLVAKSETDVNKWVDAICQVCGLKAYTQYEEQNCQSKFFLFKSSTVIPGRVLVVYFKLFGIPVFYDSQESPPVSPNSISGPYISISECISGPCLHDANLSSTTEQTINVYNIVRKLVPTPPRSPNTYAESIITDEESLSSLPNVNWDTFPFTDDLKLEFRPCNAGLESWSVKKRFGKLRIVDSHKPPAADDVLIAPRPPKPPLIAPENSAHNYLNLDGAIESSKPTTPSTPHQQSIEQQNTGVPKNQVKTTQAPVTKSSRLQTSPPQDANTDDHVFRYDFDTKNNHLDYAVSTTYSHSLSLSNEENANAEPKINGPAPPLVFRELKPGRKTNNSNISIELSPFTSHKETNAVESTPFEPPSINRKLKPPVTKSNVDDLLLLSLPLGEETIKSISSPTFVSKVKKGRHASVSDDDNNPFKHKEDKINFYQDNEAFIPASAHGLLHLQYLDLDLEKSENGDNATSAQSSQASLSATVYKTVDFTKTEAFNKTRQKVERERKQCANEMT
ncbi:uncharacterized protein LOC131668456 isoform X2 [Phymastichus coffea]|uniref:uncharacterized protein LOC131668456 isoform X2 n=1 Tax=Phymastichus coffea TaxID=108790 RepID=UPI00273B75DD|nr:uncharacterized protein LOC131668456 isoform X2 [Phymastichus coffea]